jgi:hypothetical protein
VTGLPWTTAVTPSSFVIPKSASGLTDVDADALLFVPRGSVVVALTDAVFTIGSGAV